MNKISNIPVTLPSTHALSGFEELEVFLFVWRVIMWNCLRSITLWRNNSLSQSFRTTGGLNVKVLPSTTWMRREQDENWSEKGVIMRNLGWQHLESVEMGLLLDYQWFQIQIHFVKINLLASSCRLGLLSLLKWFHDDGNENYILNHNYIKILESDWSSAALI